MASLRVFISNFTPYIYDIITCGWAPVSWFTGNSMVSAREFFLIKVKLIEKINK